MPNEKLKSLSLYDEILFDLLDIVLSVIELLIGPLKSVHSSLCILLFLTSQKSLIRSHFVQELNMWS